MNKIFTLVLLLCNFIMHAQESYPSKKAELLLGKEVKVIENNNSSGYPDFFTDIDMRTAYAPEPVKKIYTDRAAILGKTFKVTNVLRTDRGVTIELEGQDNLKLYYRYNENYDFDYPFEVKGGLTLPADFYCDYIETTKTETGTNYKAFLSPGVNLNKDVDNGKSRYYITYSIFLPKDSKAVDSFTLLLDGKKTIVKKTDLIIPEYNDGRSFRYRFTAFLSPQDIALIKTNAITGVRIGDQVAPLANGKKTQEILKCLTK